MNKRYLWIIEIKTKNGWEPSRIAYRSRKEAREEKKNAVKALKADSKALRVVKYGPALPNVWRDFPPAEEYDNIQIDELERKVEELKKHIEDSDMFAHYFD